MFPVSSQHQYQQSTRVCIRVIYLFVHFIYTISVCVCAGERIVHEIYIIFFYYCCCLLLLSAFFFGLYFYRCSLLVVLNSVLYYLAILQLPTYTHVCIVYRYTMCVCVHRKWENNRFSEQTHTVVNTQWTSRKRRSKNTKWREKCKRKCSPSIWIKQLQFFCITLSNADE